MTDDTYNGWTNRETWAVNLHLSNDQGLYELTNERVTNALADIDGNAVGLGDWFADPTEGPARRRVRRITLAADALEELVAELFDTDGDYWSSNLQGMRDDVGSVWRIDWRAVAEAWVGELPIDLSAPFDNDDADGYVPTSSAARQAWIDGEDDPEVLRTIDAEHDAE